jgi:hypothetical protein
MAIFTTYAQFRAGFNPAAPVGADGFKAWSGGDVIAPTGLTVPTTITSWPFSVVATFTLNDPTPGVDRFDWYLSQRTDNSARQYLTIDRDDALPNTRSGQVLISYTSLAYDLGYTSTPLSTKSILALFTDVEIYVRQRSTGFIRHASLLEALTGDA